MTYTYDQFKEAAENARMLDQFSDADLSLAQQNPDAGMSILKYKQDYANATTDEARALANLGAEGIRSSYGNYTGGSDGGSFYLDPLSPSSFQQEAAPEYNNRYDADIQKLLGELINREDFSYDPENDQLYSQYRKQYTREGKRATQDAIGQAAAATGGVPSSYAATAAAQAGNYYAAQMTDKIPELYQLAYNKYLNDYNMKLSDLGAVQGAEQNDYDKYLNQLNQYNTDRSFNYAVLLDEINSQKQEREEALNKALTAAEYGDYSFLQDMGINTDNNPTEWEKQYTLALLAAEYGDYSGLQALGINPGAGTAAGASGGAGSAAAEYGVSKDAIKALDKAVADYPNGVVTDRATWDYLKANFGEAALESRGLRFMGAGTAAGALIGAELTAKPAAMEGAGLTEQDWAQIAGLGIGAASASLVNELLNRGAVIETNTGALAWAPGWNATNYKQRLAAPGNAFAGTIHE